MKSLVIFIWGIINFIISGLDDFVVLIHLFRKYSAKKKYVIIGTLTALFLVLFLSYFFGNILERFIQEKRIILGLLPFSVGLYKVLQYEGDDSEEESQLYLQKMKIFTWFAFWEALFIYLINASDDMIFYSAFFLSTDGEMKTEGIFALGVVFGAFLIMYIAKDLGKYIEKGYINVNSGRLAGWVLMAIGIYMIGGGIIDMI